MSRDELSPDHGPIQPEANDLMNALAHGVDDILNPPPPGLPGAKGPRKWGFFMAVFPLDNPGQTTPGGRFNYISNADRLDVLATLKELAARLEGRKSPAGRA